MNNNSPDNFVGCCKMPLIWLRKSVKTLAVLFGRLPIEKMPVEWFFNHYCQNHYQRQIPDFHPCIAFAPSKALAISTSWMRKFHCYNIRENTASAELQMPS
jgi:hypothetical protein